jgi:hypothetical protein
MTVCSAAITGMNPKASFGVLNPPLCGIVQLTNSATLRFRNWSFTIKFAREMPERSGEPFLSIISKCR